MNVLKDIVVKASIDNIMLYSTKNMDIIKTHPSIGDLYLNETIDMSIAGRDESIHNLYDIEYYNTISSYSDLESQYEITLFGNRLWNDPFSPSFLFHINSDHKTEIKLAQVQNIVESISDRYKTDFKVYEICISIDFFAKKSAHIVNLLNEKVNLGVKWIQKESFYLNYASPNSTYSIFTSRNNSAAPYGHDGWRIDIKVKPYKISDGLFSLQQISCENWSWLYGKNNFFWFHRPNIYLINILGDNANNKTMWFARNYMQKHHKVRPFQFYYNYLEEDRKLSELVKIELDRFRWDPDETRW